MVRKYGASFADGLLGVNHAEQIRQLKTGSSELKLNSCQKLASPHRKVMTKPRMSINMQALVFGVQFLFASTALISTVCKYYWAVVHRGVEIWLLTLVQFKFSETLFGRVGQYV